MRELLLNDYTVSIWGDEKFGGVYSGNGCTIF